MPRNDAIASSDVNMSKFLNKSSSKLDVEAIVDELIHIQGHSLREYQQTEKDYKVEISTYADIASLADSLGNTLNKLNSTFTQTAYQVSSTDAAVVKAQITGNNVSANSHTINVTQLAQYHSLASNAFSASNTALNISDTLNIGIGSNNFSIALSPSDSLESVRDTINSSSNNIGVTATILATTALDGSAAYRLVLTSNQSGAANAMTLTGNAVTDLGLSNQLTAAQDAYASIDGFNLISSSNTLSNAIDSLSLQLNSLGTAQIEITENNTDYISNINTNIGAFIDNYNQLINYVNNAQLNNPTRDLTLSFIIQNMQTLITGTFGQDNATLYSLGISLAKSATIENANGQSFTATGQLQIDPQQFSQALSSNLAKVKDFFFNASTGLIHQVDTFIDNLSGPIGIIRNHSDSLNDKMRFVDGIISREEIQLNHVRKSLIKKYATLNTMLESLEKSNEFLKQQLDSINTRNRHD